MKVIETCRRYLNFQIELSFLLALHCHSHLLNCMNVEARAVCLNLNLKRKNLPILIHTQIGDTGTSQTQCELSAVIKWFLSCFWTCHVPLELSWNINFGQLARSYHEVNHHEIKADNRQHRTIAEIFKQFTLLIEYR